jgi:hypothetical protein
VFAIIGELEPIEFRFDSMAFRLRIRRMMKNVSTQVVAIARKPSTTMTAMAQCGKAELLEPDWTPAVGLEVEELPPDRVSEGGADVEAVAAAPAADATDATDAVEAEAIEARTESANVVWTAEKVACGF